MVLTFSRRGAGTTAILRLPSQPIASLNTWAASEAHDLLPTRATTHPRFHLNRHSCVWNARTACRVFTPWPDSAPGTSVVERPYRSASQSGRVCAANRETAQSRTAPANLIAGLDGDRTRTATQSAQLPHHRYRLPWLRLSQSQVPGQPDRLGVAQAH